MSSPSELLEKVEIDPSEHLLLIHRVIHQLGLTGDTAEEAFSESLVTITEAAKGYDPSKGVPVASWLGNNIRWGILNWLRKQKYPFYFDKKVLLLQEEQKLIAKSGLEAHVELNEARVELNEVLRLINTVLTPHERIVMLRTAVGMSGVKIAEELKVTPVQVHRLKKSARRKLKEKE